MNGKNRNEDRKIMMRDELILKLKDCNDLEWFNSKTTKIEFKYQQIHREIVSVASLHEYITNQIEGWNSFTEDFRKKNITSINKFEFAKAQIEYFINNFYNLKSQELTEHWNSHVQPSITQLNECFTFDSPETQFLNKILIDNPKVYNGAFEFLTGNTSHISTKEAFIGAVMAYEFSNSEHTKITERSSKERESLNSIIQSFQKNIDTSNTQLLNYLKEVDDKFNAYTDEIDEFKSAKELEVNTWFEDTKTGFTSFDDDAKKRIGELEMTYQEKLRLSKPAEYWNIRAGILKKEGWMALRWLVGVIIFACITLYSLLWLTPEDMLESVFDGQASAIRWSIIYITLISFLAVGIRAISKVMFSSFHLSRDAEEREQLSYFYLALIQDNAVDEKDKHLVLQSLFSRADTGLLKDDSAPTMPSGIDRLMNR